MAQTTEEGDCLLWLGVMQNGVPHARHNGRYVPVRRLMMEFKGIKFRAGTKYLAPSCGHKDCVELKHISQKRSNEHMSTMAKRASQTPSENLRRLKISKSKRHVAKITEQDARDIYSSTETGPVLAARYGIHRSLVNKIKRGDAWATAHYTNMFSGLMR